MALTHTGCLWEIDLTRHQINWEFITGTDQVPEKRLKISSGRYVNTPAFLHQTDRQVKGHK